MLSGKMTFVLVRPIVDAVSVADETVRRGQAIAIFSDFHVLRSAKSKPRRHAGVARVVRFNANRSSSRGMSELDLDTSTHRIATKRSARQFRRMLAVES